MAPKDCFLGAVRRRTMICCRNVKISASIAARDRNRSTTAHTMSLTRSLITDQHRPILGQPPANRFATGTGASHLQLPIGMFVGRGLACRASDLGAHPDRNSAMNARTRHDFLIMAIATAITVGRRGRRHHRFSRPRPAPLNRSFRNHPHPATLSELAGIARDAITGDREEDSRGRTSPVVAPGPPPMRRSGAGGADF
jgi:hypothetical protein